MLVQSLAKVIILSKYSVELYRFILCGDVAACREMARVLFVLQIDTVVDVIVVVVVDSVIRWLSLTNHILNLLQYLMIIFSYMLYNLNYLISRTSSVPIISDNRRSTVLLSRISPNRVFCD